MARYSEVKRMAVRQLNKVKKINQNSDLVMTSEAIISRCDFFYKKAISTKDSKVIKRIRDRQINDLTMISNMANSYLISQFEKAESIDTQ